MSPENEMAATTTTTTTTTSAADSFPTVPPVQRRKFSFPASLHSNLLGLGSNDGSIANNAASARRRFSNVSDAVSRKLSNTIGWRSVPSQEIVAQGKSLCGQYIRSRLKRSGIFNRKCGLQRLRSVANLPGGYVVCEVFHQLHIIGQELERMHPKLYTSVCRQVCVTLTSEKSVCGVLAAVARELFKLDVTWGKVVSLFAVAGGLAVDCVRQGHPDYLPGLVEAMGAVVEQELAAWIASNGGWSALLTHCKVQDDEPSVASLLGLIAVFIATVLLLIFLLRWFGKFAFI